jgi:hypothetical protein
MIGIERGRKVEGNRVVVGERGREEEGEQCLLINKVRSLLPPFIV